MMINNPKIERQEVVIDDHKSMKQNEEYVNLVKERFMMIKDEKMMKVNENYMKQKDEKEFRRCSTQK